MGMLVTLAFTSCNKFLDVKPKGVVLPEKLSDYEIILNSPTLTQTFPALLLYCTDDVQGEFSKTVQNPAANTYFWRPQMEVNTEVSPPVWGQLYRCIYNSNIIIRYVEGASDGSEQKKKEVLGEAMTIKADCYFTLLTTYAKSYNAATAATDPGLPLVTSTDVTEKTPQRSSLQATLDEIIKLLKDAAGYLPASNINKLRVTKYAAYGALARVYLYMGDYTNAGLYADKALEAPHELIDYNNYTRETMPAAELNPESLWVRISDDWGLPGFLIYSADLLTYLNDNDLRLVHFRRDPMPITRSYSNGNASFGLTYPEMYLTKAEALAREGNTADAMAIVNMLRKKRIKSGAYADQSASSKEDGIAKVLAERRRELAFSGQRWMDMKRLDQDNRMPEVKRLNLETNTVEETLPPHSPKYVFEIPTRVLLFNKGITKNH